MTSKQFPSYPDPTDVQSVPLSLQITYAAYLHEALRLQTGAQKDQGCSQLE